jgi:hypothetical protein
VSCPVLSYMCGGQRVLHVHVTDDAKVTRLKKGKGVWWPVAVAVRRFGWLVSRRREHDSSARLHRAVGDAGRGQACVQKATGREGANASAEIQRRREQKRALHGRVKV